MRTVTSPWRRACCAAFLATALVPSLTGAEEIRFGGYTWTVRSGHGGPGPNTWSADNVWLDAATNLHLKIAHRDGIWSGAEVTMQKRLGFGRYQFQTTGPLDRLDDNVVLGLFNYPTRDVGPDATHEIDIEFARWGEARNPMGNFTVWPVEPGLRQVSKAFPFALAGDDATHRFTWSRSRIVFESWSGHQENADAPLAEWTYSPSEPARWISQQPMPVHINLWLFKGQPPKDGREVEVIIRDFKYTEEEPERPTDWFQRAGYGVFVHYLEDLQNEPQQVHSLGRETSWDECVRDFDVPRFAEAMAEGGAGYVIFTMHQRTRFLIAPNATFDRLTGYQPGQACATRDLVAELYEALHAKRIPLMLYWTGDGPRTDAQAAAALGWKDPIPAAYVEKWAAVVQEYGERYRDKVAGWWVDGSYPFIGYDDEKLGILARALKAGNPDRIIAFNPGVLDKVRPYSRHEDYTCGEQNRFLDQPLSRWTHGKQWHILSYLGHDRLGNYLGAGWGQPGVRYSKADLIDYVGEVNRAGGVVSIDVLVYRDGALDRSQLEVLKALRPGLAAYQAQPPVPPGNLAFRKPARLLSLDGSHELPVNGGGGGEHHPKLGVDGRTSTTARAAGEWPWTYEVDLLEPRPVSRVKVTFAADGYATQLQIGLSADRQTWETVASADRLSGLPYAADFKGVRAQFVRVSALKPDGPDQEGAQMAVAELEVYE